jgi:hypothetical protein
LRLKPFSFICVENTVKKFQLQKVIVMSKFFKDNLKHWISFCAAPYLFKPGTFDSNYKKRLDFFVGNGTMPSVAVWIAPPEGMDEILLSAKNADGRLLGQLSGEKPRRSLMTDHGLIQEVPFLFFYGEAYKSMCVGLGFKYLDANWLIESYRKNDVLTHVPDEAISEIERYLKK